MREVLIFFFFVLTLLQDFMFGNSITGPLIIVDIVVNFPF